MTDRLQGMGGGPRVGRRRFAFMAAVLLAIASEALFARGASAPFQVTVTLLPAFKDTVDCSSRQQGSAISVSCTTPGSTTAANAQRFMLQLYRDGSQVGMVDAETLPGTVTSWKVTRLADRDFLEIVVGW